MNRNNIQVCAAALSARRDKGIQFTFSRLSAFLFLRIILIFTLLFGILFWRTPASLRANDSEQLRLDLLRPQAHTALEERYRDGSLAPLIIKAETDESLRQLEKVVEIIQNSYYQRVEMKPLLGKAMIQLQVALENPQVLKQYPVIHEKLPLLKQKIISIRSAIAQYHFCDKQTVVTVENILRKLSMDTGLGESWVAWELACALVDNLDTYSYLLTPRQYMSLKDRLGGFYVGVGVDLVFWGDYPVVFDVINDSPADQAGIVPGDRIHAINQNICREQSAGQISKLLMGTLNSTVNLVVQRENKKIQLALQRKLIESPTVRYPRLIGTEKQVGYLRIASFDHDTAMEVSRSVDSLRAEGARSLIIDLRSNGGGVMSSAIDAVRLFIDSGLIVKVKSAVETNNYVAGGRFFSCYDLSLVVLVDENTASAAEIFTAALQDHKRATVIGRKTLGKGVVQTIFSLSNSDLAICLTTASYIPPCLKSFHGRGIVPDITVEKPRNISDNFVSIKNYLSVDNSMIQKALLFLRSNHSI